MGISIDEKRVYDASEGPTPVFVAGAFGVARVATSDDLVGEFGLVRECTARDLAGLDGRLAVAADADVLLAVTGEEDVEFERLGVGPAVAAGFVGPGELLVAREDGTVLRGRVVERETAENAGGDSWTELGELADVRAIDGAFVATDSGVYRATGIAQSATKTVGDGAASAGLQHVGLDDARDVAAAGRPLAATGEGLYALGNGWMAQREGPFRAVSTAAADGGRLDRAHAAGESGLLAREDGGWRTVDLPIDGRVVALDHGAGVYAATEDGTFLLSVGDGWNHQLLGLRGVRAVAAP
ncbi:hypothetical protein BRC82_01905 [Halobacteriales archaeon QS_1_67_19]|nr:MAG: hypothetical protein BRC82_01905 [Halobacteriales archaeon QS_1_67_19]